MTALAIHNIINLLVQHEEEIADLYRTCSVIYPGAAFFWDNLVLEEQAHAQVLRELETYLATGQVMLNMDRFNVAGIQTAIDHVRKLKATVAEKNCNMQGAIAMSLDIERAIIENQFFAVFDSDSVMIKQEFNDLRKHTIDHVGRLAGLLKEMRGSS